MDEMDTLCEQVEEVACFPALLANYNTSSLEGEVRTLQGIHQPGWDLRVYMPSGCFSSHRQHHTAAWQGWRNAFWFQWPSLSWFAAERKRWWVQGSKTLGASPLPPASGLFGRTAGSLPWLFTGSSAGYWSYHSLSKSKLLSQNGDFNKGANIRKIKASTSKTNRDKEICVSAHRNHDGRH